MRRIAALLATVAIAVGLCGLAAALWSRSASFLARTWQDELERAADHQVDAVLDRLVGLGDEAFPVLARAMASSRECVAEGAARALRSEVARWSEAPPLDTAWRKRSLAKALGESFPQYGPSARRAAAGIAAALLSCPASHGAAGDSELLTACTEMLRADTTLDGHPPPNPTASELAASAVQETSHVPQDDLPRAPGLSLASDDATEATEVKAMPLAEEVKHLPPVARAGSPGPIREASPPAPLPGAPDGAADSTPAASNEPRRLSTASRMGMNKRPLGDGGEGPIASGTMDLREIARKLHAPDPQQRELAGRTLKHRGFSEVELDLARRLTDPDAGVRKKLARSLLSMPGVDAAPWLLELVGDADADVRLEAMTLLVTTADPALLDPLRPFIQADPDERIRRLADRLSRETLVSEQPGKAERLRR